MKKLLVFADFTEPFLAPLDDVVKLMLVNFVLRVVGFGRTLAGHRLTARRTLVVGGIYFLSLRNQALDVSVLVGNLKL